MFVLGILRIDREGKGGGQFIHALVCASAMAEQSLIGSEGDFPEASAAGDRGTRRQSRTGERIMARALWACMPLDVRCHISIRESGSNGPRVITT